MGASVHTFIEYRQYKNYFAFGRIHMLREVKFLCAIAWRDGGITDEMPYPPRDSFPANASWQARDSFFVRADDAGPEYGDEASIEEYVRRRGGWAVKEYKRSGLLPPPDLTDIGWLSLKELDANLAQRGLEPGSLSPDVRAMLAAMRELSGAYGRNGVRLIFWITL